jgi:hypothetical protein
MKFVTPEDWERIAIQQNRIQAVFGLDSDGEPIMAMEFCDLSKPYEDSLIDLFEGLKLLEILKVGFMQDHGLLNQGDTTS